MTVNNESGKEVSGYIHNSVVEILASDEEAEEERPAPRARRPAPKYNATKEFARGGVKLMAGLSMGNLTLSETISTEVKKTSKMGFMGGVGFESGGRIAFELDLLYSPGGAVLKSIDPASKERITISGTAITVPIMVKIRFLPGTTPYILAGGEIGYHPEPESGGHERGRHYH